MELCIRLTGSIVVGSPIPHRRRLWAVIPTQSSTTFSSTFTSEARTEPYIRLTGSMEAGSPIPHRLVRLPDRHVATWGAEVQTSTIAEAWPHLQARLRRERAAGSPLSPKSCKVQLQVRDMLVRFLDPVSQFGRCGCHTWCG